MDLEERYIVIKLKDIEEYLPDDLKTDLKDIIDVVAVGRRKDCKRPLKCAVVESDWPEYAAVVASIQDRNADMFYQHSLIDISAEMLALSVKAGRRASYDLLHAAELIPDLEMRKMFTARAADWLNIFANDNGVKDYRHSLHVRIARLEARIRSICAEAGFDPADWEVKD